RQDVVDIRPHRPRPSRPPNPDRGRDIVDDGNRWIGHANRLRHAKVEVRAVDDDKHVGLGLDDRPGGRPYQAKQFRQLPQDRRDAVERDLAHREERAQSEARHALAADAEKTRLRYPAAQRLHQARGELVAGFLARDEEHRERAGGRRQAHDGTTPVTKMPAASARRMTSGRSTIITLPALIAIPPSPAAITPSTVRVPIVGMSTLRS